MPHTETYYYVEETQGFHRWEYRSMFGESSELYIPKWRVPEKIPMASIFYQNKAIGYVLTGLLAFFLGVCATVLCYRLKSGKQHDKGNQNNGGNH